MYKNNVIRIKIVEIMALFRVFLDHPSGIVNLMSMCDCKQCGILDLSVLVEILSGLDSDHGTGPRRNGSVNSRSTLC